MNIDKNFVTKGQNEPESFQNVWSFLRKYSQLVGPTLIETSSRFWRVLNWLFLLNLILLNFELLYACFVTDKDMPSLCFHTSFLIVTTFGFVYQVTLCFWRQDILQILSWCESRHQIQKDNVKFHSVKIFQEAFEFSFTSLRRRMVFSIALFAISMTAGTMFTWINDRDTVLSVYLPNLKPTSAITVLLYSVQHVLAIAYILINGVIIGCVTAIVFRYAYGQLELVLALIKDLSASAKCDSKTMNQELYYDVVNLLSDARRYNLYFTLIQESDR